MIPNTQSGLNWTSIAVFQAENDGGVHFWIIGYVQPQKVPITPPKIAILRPNLNKDVPDQCATVAQYSSFQRKNQLVGCSEPKLQAWPLYGHLSSHKWLKMAILATFQVILRCLKMVTMNFPCPKTWGYTPKSGKQDAQNQSYKFGHCMAI